MTTPLREQVFRELEQHPKIVWLSSVITERYWKAFSG
jgi:hypothetical protein